MLIFLIGIKSIMFFFWCLGGGGGALRESHRRIMSDPRCVMLRSI